MTLPPVGRRGVIASGGLLLTGTALQTTPLGRSVLAALGFGDEVDPAYADSEPFKNGIRVEQVRRPADLMAVDLVLINLEVLKHDSRTLLVNPSSTKAFLGFVLPGQNLGEALPKGSQFVSLSELALPSLLVFQVPKGWRADFELEALLDWADLKPLWTKKATNPVSRIEAPYRLRLQPRSQTAWQHATLPAEGPVKEVWHTRLVGLSPGTKTPDPRVANPGVTAIKALPTPLPMPLTDDHRAEIVTKSRTVAPIQADRMILSSLGATLELHGRWPDTDGLLAWDHRSTMGRDQYVKTVESGFLAPWGHRAAKVTETWRTMSVRNGRPTAIQQSFQTIVLLDPVVDTSLAYVRTAGGANAGCALPFSSVRSTVAVTGRLTAVVNGQVPYRYDTDELLQIPFVGRDWSGREVPFSSIVMWIASGGTGATAATSWNGLNSGLRMVALGGRRVAVAPGVGAGTDGSTTLPLRSITVEISALLPQQIESDSRRALFRPSAASVFAQVPGLGALTEPGYASGAVDHGYHPAFLANQENVGGVVLGVLPSAGGSTAGFVPAEATGALFRAPTYQGFSRKGGAVLASSPDALADAATGDFHPANVFAGVPLLGGIDLSQLVDPASGLGELSPGLPQLVHKTVDGRQNVTMRVTPTLHSATIEITDDVELRIVPGELVIEVDVATGGTAAAQRRIDARLTNTGLQLAGILVLPIEELRFVSGAGRPPDVTFRLGDLQFLGPLAFVQQLAEKIAPLLEDGARGTADRGGVTGARVAPVVNVSPQGITAGISFSLPDVAVGAFTLSGLGFGIEVGLDFSNVQLIVGASFASHEDPFVVTFGPYGGGGYLALRTRGGQVDNLEVSLFIAGAVGINLGVAAGAISVQAGFILAIPTNQPVAVTAFFRASGCLEVLGIASVSVVFEIALEFIDTNPSTLIGTASLQLKVKVLCCSKTVKASVSRTFAGGRPGDQIGDPLPPSRGLRRGPAIDAPPDGRVYFATTYPSSTPWNQFASAFGPVFAEQP